ncbi:MAG: hypothetical protein C0490_08165 [Marivirga sp.]|nr:hypothetical protein [Marivirga sp.]
MLHSKNATDILVAYVRDAAQPTLQGLLAVDWPALDTTHYVLTLLIGDVNKVQHSQKDGCDFISNGAVVLKVRKNEFNLVSGEGQLVLAIETLLTAIRIHEIDSFDWVWLPPNMRESLISERLQNTGINNHELRKATSIWTSKIL